MRGHLVWRPVVGFAALAALVLALAAVSGAAAAALRPAVVCPQAGSATGCCPPPVQATATASACCAPIPTECCTSGGCTQVTVSIRVSPNPVLEGRSIAITGEATGAGGAAVALWQQLPGGQAKQIATTTTNASGAYSFTRPRGSVTTDRVFYATVGTARSASISESVTASVKLSRPRARARVGRRVVLHGTVAPAHHSEVVLLQRRRGGRWRTFRRARLNRHSKVSFGLKFTRRGTVRLRLVLPADAGNARSSSHALALAVAPS